MNIGIVIPCYNESKRLQLEVFSQFITTHPDYYLCFVNDGSADNTLHILTSFANAHINQVRVVDLKVNQGKAEAVRQGINYLINNTTADIVGFIDADLSTGFEDIKFLVDNLCEQHQDQSMVFGSRKLNNAENIDRSPFRKLASNVVGMSISQIVGLPINDTQCGAKLFKRNLAISIFKETFLSRWLFDVEIFIRMKKIFGNKTMNHAIELPLRAWKDIDGSKLGFRDSIKIPVALSKIAYAYSFAS